MDNLDLDFYENFVFPCRGRVLSSDSLRNIYINDQALIDKSNFLFASRRGSSKSLKGGSVHSIEDLYMVKENKQNTVKVSKFRNEGVQVTSSCLPQVEIKIEDSLSANNSKTFSCQFPDCGKSYKAKSRLQIHERTHLGVKPFKCTECEKSFNEKGNLMTHMRIHTGEKPYVCNVDGCKKSFKAYGHLSDHLKRHFNVRPFECEFCHAGFSRRTTLKNHMMTHTGEKPFACTFPGCEKRFSEKGNMKTHLKTHEKKKNLPGSEFKPEAEPIREQTEESKPAPFFVHHCEEFSYLGKKITRNSRQTSKEIKVENSSPKNTKEVSTGEPISGNDLTVFLSNSNDTEKIDTPSPKHSDRLLYGFNYLQMIEKIHQCQSKNQDSLTLNNVQHQLQNYYQKLLMNFKNN